MTGAIPEPDMEHPHASHDGPSACAQGQPRPHAPDEILTPGRRVAAGDDQGRRHRATARDRPEVGGGNGFIIHAGHRRVQQAIGIALALPVRHIRKLRLLANVLPAMLDHMAKATDAFDEADDPDASRGEDGAASSLTRPATPTMSSIRAR